MGRYQVDRWLGLSPLTRGTLCWRPQARYFHRFIPAHAGNTHNPDISCRKCSVYPRSRGEHSNTAPSSTTACGLSPLTRGTLDDVDGQEVPGRFIPAHAGNTPPSGSKMTWRAVYPRSRGEHRKIKRKVRNVTGLSPLTRGTRSGAQQLRRSARFIPAHAGNTLKLSC